MYMESSHANNTGMAKFINDCLYYELNPAQKLNSNVRNTINGFPIQLYINDELIGIFNFNLDKGCTDSFGIDNKTFPNCLSYEVTANSDITAGAFNKWTSNSELTEQEYYARDFEIRYPDEREENDDHAELIRLVNWVSDATDEEFKNNLEQYFNKEYLFKYFLNVMVFGQVDNLGKNMMLTTWDGNIWYPQFYDLDF